jgi:hypothetical protein
LVILDLEVRIILNLGVRITLKEKIKIILNLGLRTTLKLGVEITLNFGLGIAPTKAPNGIREPIIRLCCSWKP